MPKSKRTVPLFLLCSLIAAYAFCDEAQFPAESDTTTVSVLSYAFPSGWGLPLTEQELHGIEGGDLMLAVDRDAKTMKVYTFNKAELLRGGLETLKSYEVPVTTEVVRHKDVSKDLPKTAKVNTSKKEKNVDGDSYHPVQIPAGTYSLDYSKENVGGYGPGVHIDVAVETPLVGGGAYTAKDFFVHGTDYDNTNGCVGVKEDAEKVVESYKSTGGDKTITITEYKTAQSTDSPAKKKTSAPEKKGAKSSGSRRSFSLFGLRLW